MLQSLFYLTIALHVSGIIITHLQELLFCAPEHIEDGVI
jgi:hypothetical protein